MKRLLKTAIVLCLGLTGAASADDEFERVPPVRHEATAAECGECHMAYQPALLPAKSWVAIMDNLGDHFGEDASLRADLVADIKSYLTTNAGRGESSKLRITEQSWWTHEHDEVPQSKWRRDDIRSKANCTACHRDAERGLYDD